MFFDSFMTIISDFILTTRYPAIETLYDEIKNNTAYNISMYYDEEKQASIIQNNTGANLFSIEFQKINNS